MLTTTTLPQEADRLESLESYDVLDTPAEKAYDALTRLAADLCGTPLALINLVDADRFWFKSRYGTFPPELPREDALCGRVIRDSRELSVGDLRTAQASADHPLLAAGFLAYAGIPLIGRDGLPLGTLCVLDRRPRRFTQTQLGGLRQLAAQVVALLELRRAENASGRSPRSLIAEASDPVRLRQALDDGELRPHFQPMVDLRTGRTVGCEALLRWHHPQHGVLLPASFLSAIESSGLVLPVGREVLDRSLGTLAALRADPTVPALIGMAVNVSGAQLRQPGLAETVLQYLERHGIPAEDLSIELTETAALHDNDTAIARSELLVLREAGVHLALDDYGTGWSALARLLELPLTALKLDRSLVKGLPDDPRSLLLARSTFGLARDMGLAVVSEGVETTAQRDSLLDMGGQFGQGWLFSRPLDLPALLTRLREEARAQQEGGQDVPVRHVASSHAAPRAATLDAVLDALPDATALLDANGSITAVNLAWRMFTIDNGGATERTGVGVNYLAVCDSAASSGCQDAADAAAAIRAVLRGASVERDLEYACPSPAVGRWFMLRTTPLGHGRSGALISHVNTTRRKTAELELETRASHDPLTGLANRALLHRQLNAALAVGAGSSRQVGVLCLDLNGFKPVNDRFGHAAGDEVLLEVAHRLRGLVRPQDTVARAGGDEFTLVLPDITAPGLRRLEQRVTADLARPHVVYGQQLLVTASVGSHLATKGDDSAACLEVADQRMYVLKRRRTGPGPTALPTPRAS
jgi:diguanylate cyclase (GGDEF)-like protein